MPKPPTTLTQAKNLKTQKKNRRATAPIAPPRKPGAATQALKTPTKIRNPPRKTGAATQALKTPTKIRHPPFRLT